MGEGNRESKQESQAQTSLQSPDARRRLGEGPSSRGGTGARHSHQDQAPGLVLGGWEPTEVLVRMQLVTGG